LHNMNALNLLMREIGQSYHHHKFMR